MIIVSDGRDLAPGALVAFYLILNQMLAPIGQISTATQSVAGASANVERAAALLEAPTETDPPDAVEVGPLKHEIRFENVSFAYPDGKPILKGLTLTIKAGPTAAFVGPSGAGKSSILQLLPRLYEPTRGTITWDGVDLKTASLTSLRRQIGLVPQDVAMLNATVAENIRLGDDQCSDQDVWLAAHLAAADEEIERLPQGYDTVIGGGTFRLSAGQRQRIAVARAMLRKPSLLILDEATSALDATRQRTISGASSAARRGADGHQGGPPAGDGGGRRPDLRAGRRPAGGAGHPRRAPGAEGVVRQPVRGPDGAAASGPRGCRPRRQLAE